MAENNREGIDEEALREEILEKKKENIWKKDLTKPIRDKAAAVRNSVDKWTDDYTPTFKKMAAKSSGQNTQSSASNIDGTKVIAWIIFLLSLVMYYYIDWLYRYNGIDIGFFKNLNSLDVVFKSGIFTFFLILLAWQFIFKKPSDPAEIKAAVVVDFILAVMFVLSKYSPAASFHLIFAIAIWFFLLRTTKEPAAAYNTLTLLIIFDFLGFSIIKYIFGLVGMAGGVAVVNAMIFPIYSLYLLSFLEVYSKSKLAAVLLFIILLLYIFGFVQSSEQYQDVFARLSEEQTEASKTFLQTSSDRARAFGSVLSDPLACMGKIGSDEYAACLKERQYARECRDKKDNKAEYQLCIESKKLGVMQGAEDLSIKDFSKVTFEQINQFPKLVQKELKTSIPMQLNIDSPNKELTVAVSCKFLKEKENITGIAEPAVLEKIVGTKKETIFCSLPQDKAYVTGKYKTIFEAEIKGMSTTSRLSRLIVKKDITEERKNELLSLHKMSQTEASKSPDEFAAFSFGVGTPSTTPFIDQSQTQALTGNIENRAEGAIVSIQEITLELVPGITPSENCLVYFDIAENGLKAKEEAIKSISSLTKKGDTRFLLGCKLDISPSVIPSDYEEYYKREFSSNMRYTYQIAKEIVFEVE